jgi:hypothetical protein
MHTLKNWRAKRAGGRITVYGTNAETGQADKVVGVDVIEPHKFKQGIFTIEAALATDKNGEKHLLRA